jgi:DNA-binding winged helix-turn-helix (wHTH) protein
VDVSFGPYRLLVARRLLLEGDKPVRLGSRAFDILTALIERAGEVVGKEELIARAWPATYVEEANLKIQVSALRRVLGDGQGGHRYIVTVPGRGYNFVARYALRSLLRAASRRKSFRRNDTTYRSRSFEPSAGTRSWRRWSHDFRANGW